MTSPQIFFGEPNADERSTIMENLRRFTGDEESANELFDACYEVGERYGPLVTVIYPFEPWKVY
jgi:hypothetical protein